MEELPPERGRLVRIVPGRTSRPPPSRLLQQGKGKKKQSPIWLMVEMLLRNNQEDDGVWVGLVGRGAMQGVFQVFKAQPMMKEPPPMNSFGDVVRWVVEELGAFCPSPERLAAYWTHPDAPQFRDIRYHVEEAGCPICLAERPEPPSPPHPAI